MKIIHEKETLKQLQDEEGFFDSMINPPRNREAGYPRVGRDVADPAAREKKRGRG